MAIFRRRLPSPDAEPPTAPPCYPLNTSEASWRDEQHVRACDFVRYYTGIDTDQPTLAQLDATVLAWAADSSGDQPDAGDIDNALGIVFGEILAADSDADLSWASATGPDGPDLALHTDDDQVVVFPRVVVAEHLDDGPTEAFFVRLHAELTRDISQMQHH